MEHRFTSGHVLTQTFSVFFSNFVAFGLICGIVLAPSLILQIWGITRAAGDPSSIPWATIAGTFLLILLGPLTTAALTFGVFQHVRGKHASVGDCLSIGLKRLLPVLGVSILAGLIQAVGMLLCLVPGFIAATILAAAVPAAVIENPGVTAALSRSSSLTKDYRWPVFGVIFGIGVLSFAAQMLVALVGPASIFILIGGTVLHTIVFTGLGATAPALIYYHLRRAKESIDVEEIAAVFD